MESKELIVRDPLTPAVWKLVQSMAPTMHQARLFGVASPAQAAAIMLKGFELGLTLTASFDLIQVIQGRPTLSPRGAMALILQSPVCEKLEIDDQVDDKGNPTACEVTMKRKDGLEYSVTFSMGDAKRAGLVKPDSGWAKYPANMLRWRAVGFCADVVFPDVIGGMKRADEMGADISAEGDVIDGSWAETPEPEPLTLDSLAAQYGPEAVMAANDGAIPATPDELAAVAEKLGRD